MMKEFDMENGHVVSTLDELKEDFYHIVINNDGKMSYLFEHIEEEAVRYGKGYIFHANIDEDALIIENRENRIQLKSYQPHKTIINKCLGLIEDNIKQKNKSKKNNT